MNNTKNDLFAKAMELLPRADIQKVQVEAIFPLSDIEQLTQSEIASLGFIPAPTVLESWKDRKIHDVVLHQKGEYLTPARPYTFYTTTSNTPLAITTKGDGTAYNPANANDLVLNDLLAATYVASTTVKINTAVDKINYTLHPLASFAIFPAMLSFAPQIGGSAILGIGLSALISWPMRNGFEKSMSEEFQATPPKQWPNGSQYLPALGKKYATILNITNPPIYLFDEYADSSKSKKEADDGAAEKDKKPLIKIFTKIFDKFANAAAYGSYMPGVLVVRPLLRTLNNPEKNAVLAHEFSHIAAQHMNRSRWPNFFSSASNQTAYFHYLAVSFSEVGFWPIIAANLIGSLFNKLSMKALGLDKEKTNHKAVASKIGAMTTTALVLDAAYMEAKPDVLLAWGLVKGVALSHKAIDSYFSSRKEYQADRIGAVLTGNPIALADSLEKIEIYNNDVAKEKCGPLPPIVAAFIKSTTIFDRLLTSHPSNAARRRQMEKIAKTMQHPKVA